MLIIDDIGHFPHEHKRRIPSRVQYRLYGVCVCVYILEKERKLWHGNCFVTGHIDQGTAKYIPRPYNAIGYTTLNNEHLSCLHTTGFFFLSFTGSCSRNLVALGDGGWADYSVPPFPLGRKVDTFYTNSLHRTWG